MNDNVLFKLKCESFGRSIFNFDYAIRVTKIGFKRKWCRQMLFGGLKASKLQIEFLMRNEPQH